MAHITPEEKDQVGNARVSEFEIVGLCGRKGSGKDAVASVLCGKHGFVRVGFADKLKQAVGDIYGLHPVQLDDPKQKERVDPFWGVSPRQIMQGFGMLLRDHGDAVVPDGTMSPATGGAHRAADIWLDAAFREIDRIRLSRTDIGPRGAVITDVRFPNEVERIEAEGGRIFRVRREQAERREDDHISEHALDHFEFEELANHSERLRDVEALADQIAASLWKREKATDPLVKSAHGGGTQHE